MRLLARRNAGDRRVLQREARPLGCEDLPSGDGHGVGVRPCHDVRLHAGRTGRSLAGSTAGTYWGDVKLFDAATGGETRTLVSGWGAVNTCTVSPEGRLVAAGSNDQTLKVWDLGSGEERATLAEHAAPITGCAFAPDGWHLFSAASDRTIKLWDVGRPGPAVRKHLEMVNSCAFFGKRETAGGRLGRPTVLRPSAGPLHGRAEDLGCPDRR